MEQYTYLEIVAKKGAGISSKNKNLPNLVQYKYKKNFRLYTIRRKKTHLEELLESLEF